MSSRRLSRRALLRGAGGVSLGLPFLNAMRPARAGGATAPKRVVLWVTPNGFPIHHWKCAVTASESTEFELSPILAPLESIRQDCTFIEGIGYESSFDPEGHAGAHEAGNTSMFTGTWAGVGSQFGGDNKLAGWAVSESVDAALAASVGQETRFPSYYLGVIPSVGNIGSRMFYAGKDQPVTPIFDPQKAWDALFSEIALDESQKAALLAKRKTALSAVADEARALRCTLDAEDRARLDAHLTQVEELARRLDISALASCEPPTLDEVPNIFAFENVPELGRMQMDQLVMALSCDLTRVAGFQWVAAGNNSPYGWLGISEGHHEMTHANTTDANAKLAQIGAWYAEQLRYFVERLKATEDVDGTSLFDNTVILWASECGTPWYHDRHDVALTLVGSGQGYFKTGRYLKLPGQTPHNRLLLNLLECMGDPRETFGGPAYCAGGPLDELRA